VSRAQRFRNGDQKLRSLKLSNVRGLYGVNVCEELARQPEKIQAQAQWRKEDVRKQRNTEERDWCKYA
jgi:hypothetical protein